MYHDFLIRIKNAGRARLETAQAPFSKLNFAIAKVLMETGYLEDVQKRVVGKKSFIDVRLRYKGKQPIFTDFKIMSKPGRRLYSGYRELRPVRQHFGLAILSTPQGVVTNRSARKQKVGGEYLFQVW
jgi:small subunit ribosomal protein S8